MRGRASILVVGAGPAGLAMAVQAHDHGAAVRVIERRPAAFRPSRALILHARTLEVLRPLGVTDALLTAVRPDGYIGLRTETADTTQLDAWLGLILACWPR